MWLHILTRVFHLLVYVFILFAKYEVVLRVQQIMYKLGFYID
jgi:hypothetical protein